MFIFCIMYRGEHTRTHIFIHFHILVYVSPTQAPHLAVLFEFHIPDMFAFMKNNWIEKILLHKKNLVLFFSLPIFSFLFSFRFIRIRIWTTEKILLWILEWWSIFSVLFLYFSPKKKKRTHESDRSANKCCHPICGPISFKQNTHLIFTFYVQNEKDRKKTKVYIKFHHSKASST